jgi:lipopolysaccharide transport system permease protein
MTFAGFDRRDLGMLLSLSRMSLGDRFLGSGLGLIWAVLSPLLLMAIFCFVFTFVFPGRLPGREGALPFVIWLISGYGPWLALSEGLNSASSSVVGGAGLVKNIAFKSELLPLSATLLGLVPLAVSLVVIIVLQVAGGEQLALTMALLPVVILLQTVLMAGLGMFLAALNVFVRDTALVLPNLLTLLLFASPIFYPLSAYPEAVRHVLALNPFYVLAECYRAPILEGRAPQLWMMTYLALFASACFVGGLWWFRRLKSFFDTRL